jgi:hypothetical protein
MTEDGKLSPALGEFVDEASKQAFNNFLEKLTPEGSEITGATNDFLQRYFQRSEKISDIDNLLQSTGEVLGNLAMENVLPQTKYLKLGQTSAKLSSTFFDEVNQRLTTEHDHIVNLGVPCEEITDSAMICRMLSVLSNGIGQVLGQAVETKEAVAVNLLPICKALADAAVQDEMYTRDFDRMDDQALRNALSKCHDVAKTCGSAIAEGMRAQVEIEAMEHEAMGNFLDKIGEGLKYLVSSKLVSSAQKVKESVAKRELKTVPKASPKIETPSQSESSRLQPAPLQFSVIPTHVDGVPAVGVNLSFEGGCVTVAASASGNLGINLSVTLTGPQAAIAAVALVAGVVAIGATSIIKTNRKYRHIPFHRDQKTISALVNQQLQVHGLLTSQILSEEVQQLEFLMSRKKFLIHERDVNLVNKEIRVKKREQIPLVSVFARVIRKINNRCSTNESVEKSKRANREELASCEESLRLLVETIKARIDSSSTATTILPLSTGITKTNQKCLELRDQSDVIYTAAPGCRGTSSYGGEFVENLRLTDISNHCKWCLPLADLHTKIQKRELYLQQDFPTPRKIHCYQLRSCPDHPERDPMSWLLYGQRISSNEWELIETRTHPYPGPFEQRNLIKSFELSEMKQEISWKAIRLIPLSIVNKSPTDPQVTNCLVIQLSYWGCHFLGDEGGVGDEGGDGKEKVSNIECITEISCYPFAKNGLPLEPSTDANSVVDEMIDRSAVVIVEAAQMHQAKPLTFFTFFIVFLLLLLSETSFSEKNLGPCVDHHDLCSYIAEHHQCK